MMKLTLIAFALLACLAVEVHSEDVEAAWEYHVAHFPVKASSAEEREKRRELFAAAHDEIESHNKKNHSFQMAHNKFSTMTVDEKKRYLGVLPPPNVQMIAREMAFSSDAASRVDCKLPDSVDFRTHRCMPAVKNQGDRCSSCWAFTATTTVEFGSCINTGVNVLLSEQQIIDCSVTNFGCNGGWYNRAWEYIASTSGQDTSASYPYTGAGGTCKASKGIVGAKVSTIGTVVNAIGENEIMFQLVQSRLVAAAMTVVNSFYNYKAGIYTEGNCLVNVLGYHAVVVVGYGTLNGVKYWVIRNSWGSSWGAAGYALFQRGTNLCLLEGWKPATTSVM